MIKYLIALCLLGAGTTWLVLVPLHPKGEPGGAARSRSPSGAAAADSFRGVGYVEPLSETRRLAFRGGGVIGRCNVRVGQQVRRGEVLMSLHNDDLAAAVESAKRAAEVAGAQRDLVLSGAHPQEIAAAEQKVAQSRATLELADKVYGRKRAIQKGGVAQNDLDTAEADAKKAAAVLRADEAELERLRQAVRPEDRLVADAKVRQAAARVGELRWQYEDTLLRAPFDGTVLEIVRREGESARPTDPEPAVIFGDVSRLRVRAEIDERYVSRLLVGQQVTVTGRGLGRASFAGSVTEVRGIMGKKTVFARTATERKDLDVVQVLIDMQPAFRAPVGLEVDVEVLADAATGERGGRGE